MHTPTRLTPSQASERYGVSKYLLRMAYRRGALPEEAMVRLSPRSVYYDAAVLDRFFHVTDAAGLRAQVRRSRR